MRTLAASACLFGLLLPAGRGEERGRLADALALQEAMETLIAAAEPSIACIVVSRSDEYKRWHAAPSADTPGKLGKFDADAARRLVPPRDGEQLEAILALDLANPNHVPESFGSGMVLDGSGLILTNAHVVRHATKVYVRLPGNKGSYADIYASDPRSDLAVLKLLDPPEGLAALKFGDGGKARKGQFVVLLANPYAAGFRDGSPSASWGMIANVRRRAPGRRSELERDRERQTLHHYGTLLQVDARITLGSSGGALLNLKGELIGITTSLAAVLGTEVPGGFAVPFDAGMKRIVEVLERGEEVEYGFLGVTLQESVGRRGALIQFAVENSPAARAGLQMGDVVVAINGVPVHDNDDLFLEIGTHLAGSTVRIEALRGGVRRTFPVTLAKYAVAGPIIAARQPPARVGLRVDYTSILAQRGVFGPRRIPEGVMIREVVPNSPADKAQLQAEKVITRVNNRTIHTPAEFYQAMEKAGRSVEITFLDSEGREEQVTLENK